MHSLAESGLTIEQSVRSLIRKVEERGGQVDAPPPKLGRPEELGFEFRNTIYEEYDADNNIINIIPYHHKFEIATNSEWRDPLNIVLVAFTYFDFDSLDLGELQLTSGESFGQMVGDLTVDNIINQGKVISTARVYRTADRGVRYTGPVHYHSQQNPGPNGYVGYMAGYPGMDMGPKLNSVLVPVTKIQDFRGMTRSKEVNYQPPQFEHFNSRDLGLSFLEKRNKNFFSLYNVQVDKDRFFGGVKVKFTIDTAEIYKFNSRYYDFAKNIVQIIEEPNQFLHILTIKILRRRVEKVQSGTNRLGFSAYKKYNPETQADHLVASSGAPRAGRPVRMSVGRKGFIEESAFGFSQKRKMFHAKDYQIDTLQGDAVYQYGVEITMLDTTRNFFAAKLRRARTSLSSLKRYSNEAKIPVFDRLMISNYDDVGIAGFSEPPEYTKGIPMGNYDVKANKLTREFINRALQEYRLEESVAMFLELMIYSFGKSTVSMTSSEVNTVQSDDDLYREGQYPLFRGLEDGYLSTPEELGSDIEKFLYGLNATPRSIDSFIRSFEDLILEMEDYFDLDYVDALNTGGAGYNASADSSFTVQRWFKYADAEQEFARNVGRQ